MFAASLSPTRNLTESAGAKRKSPESTQNENVANGSKGEDSSGNTEVNASESSDVKKVRTSSIASETTPIEKKPLTPVNNGRSRNSSLPRYRKPDGEKSAETTPSKILGYLNGNSRSASKLESVEEGGLLRRRKLATRTPVADKLRQFFEGTITVTDDKVREVVINLRSSKSAMKFDFKEKSKKQEAAIKELQNLCITLIGETKQVQTLCVGYENDNDSRIREASLQVQEMSQAKSMLESNENRHKKEYKSALEKAATAEAELNQLKQENGPLTKKIKDLENRLSEMVVKFTEQQSSNRSLMTDIKRLENDKTDLKKECNEAKANTIQEMKRIGSENEVRMKEVAEEFKTSKKNYELKSESAISVIKNEVSMKEIEIQKISKELCLMRESGQKAQSKSAADAVEISRLTEVLSQNKEQVSKKDADLVSMSANISDLQQKIAEERGGLKTELNNAQTKISTLEEKLTMKDEELLAEKENSIQLEMEREMRRKAEHRESEERQERIATSAQLLATQNDCTNRLAEQEKRMQCDIDAQKDIVLQVQDELVKSETLMSTQSDSIMVLENEANHLRHEVEHACAAHETVEKLGRVTGELEILRKRMRETSDNKALEIGKALARIEELEEEAKSAEGIRRKLHNTIQELRGNVRVFARVRPFLPNDGVADGAEPAIIPRTDGASLRIYKNASSDARGEDHAFSFDRVFGPSSSQENVFNEVSEFVQSALDGYNVCLFSYGQTGSGKTHTMQGFGNGSMRGLISRAMEQVGSYKNELETKGWVYHMEVSFVEIYNEAVRDLLRVGSADDFKHEIKKDANGTTYITDVIKKEVNPNNTEEMDSIMELAARHRSVGQTAMNERSSRSHSVFCLHLKASNAEQGITLKGALNLVDLAGSERLARSEATGARMKETVAINKSLSSLTDVFVAIGNKQSHIPFRNSKLTYLLQPALSGDGKTLMMVNLSPTEESFNESVCSLRFASQVNQCELGKPKKNTQNDSGSAPSKPSSSSRTAGTKRVR